MNSRDRILGIFQKTRAFVNTGKPAPKPTARLGLRNPAPTHYPREDCEPVGRSRAPLVRW